MFKYMKLWNLSFKQVSICQLNYMVIYMSQFWSETFFTQLKLKYFKTKFPYRSYCHRYQVIFVHIPKTAGTSVLELLMGEKIRRDHLPYSDYQKAQGKLFISYFKFCFVRNPFDRLVSAYEYLKKGGNQNSDLYYKELINDKYPTFDSFVLDYLDQNKVYSQLLLKPQYTFIYNEKEVCMVDFVGRFERINDDFDIIAKRIKIKNSLKKSNASKRLDYKDYYNNQNVKEKVIKLYSKDFELLNYSDDI